MVHDFIFFYFLVFDLKEEIENGLILVVEKENLDLH